MSRSRKLVQSWCLLVIPMVVSTACFDTVQVWAQIPRTTFKFNFGVEKAKGDVLRISPDTVYTSKHGYGLVSPVVPTGRSQRSICSDNRPFSFALDLPEGNYNVNVTLGDTVEESTTTLTVEARRLVLRELRPSRGFRNRKFTVNVRHRQLVSGETVRLKPDEVGHLDWDNQLTLNFSGARPCVHSLEINRTDDAITVYLAGDSTVTDQAKEPWSAWGQVLPSFFQEGVAIANYAESGESLKSFLGERRFEKILETIKPGDYLFIQFAHNDQKPGASHADPFAAYQEILKLYVDETRKRGAIPVLVTSMHRRKFDDQDRIVNTLGDYPDAMRQLTKTENVPLIDLNSASKTLFEALGPDGTLKAFVHYPARTFPGQERELKDDTHFNDYGAYELAQCVVAGIRANRLGIVKYLRDDIPAFNPSHPDSPDAWMLPANGTGTETSVANH